MLLKPKTEKIAIEVAVFSEDVFAVRLLKRPEKICNEDFGEAPNGGLLLRKANRLLFKNFAAGFSATQLSDLLSALRAYNKTTGKTPSERGVHELL